MVCMETRPNPSMQRINEKRRSPPGDAFVNCKMNNYKKTAIRIIYRLTLNADRYTLFQDDKII